jgi:hypothetical protein
MKSSKQSLEKRALSKKACDAKSGRTVGLNQLKRPSSAASSQKNNSKLKLNKNTNL